MKLVGKIKEYGLFASFIFFLRKYLKTFVYKMYFLRLNIDINKINDDLKLFDLDGKELSFDDFTKGTVSNFTPSKLKNVCSRLSDGTHKAYGIIKEDKLIYSTWISLENLSLPIPISIKLQPLDGSLEDSFCDKSARGMGIHYKMNLFRIKKLYEEGKRRVIAIVMDGNIPALAVQKKSGFEELGCFYCGKIFNIPFSTLKIGKYDNK